MRKCLKKTEKPPVVCSLSRSLGNRWISRKPEQDFAFRLIKFRLPALHNKSRSSSSPFLLIFNWIFSGKIPPLSTSSPFSFLHVRSSTPFSAFVSHSKLPQTLPDGTFTTSPHSLTLYSIPDCTWALSSATTEPHQQLLSRRNVRSNSAFYVFRNWKLGINKVVP